MSSRRPLPWPLQREWYRRDDELSALRIAVVGRGAPTARRMRHAPERPDPCRFGSRAALRDAGRAASGGVTTVNAERSATSNRWRWPWEEKRVNAKNVPKGKAEKDNAAKADVDKRGAAASAKELSNKDYEREMKTLHVELVKLQPMGPAERAQGLRPLRGPRRRRQGWHDQGPHRAGQPAGLSRHCASAADRAREVPHVRPALFPHLPAAGEVVIFDRSWYNRAGVERVMGFCSDHQAQRFPDNGAAVRESDDLRA